MTLIVNPYEVTVRGHPAYTYFAASRGKAQADAWRDFGVGADINYGGFLKISRCRRIPNPPEFGEKITVSGKPAYRIPVNFGYPCFVRPDSDVILTTHPLDLEAGWSDGRY